MNKEVDVHGFLRYRDKDVVSGVAVKQKEWYRGFPVSYETENPFLFVMSFFAMILLAVTMAIVTPTQKETRCAENNHQQQKEEEKAVINASKAITTHMVIPPCCFKIG